MIRPLELAVEAVRSRGARMGASRGLLWIAAALCGGALFLFALDNLLHLGAAARVLFDLLLLTALVCLGTRFLALPAVQKGRREEAAIRIERAFPELDNRLINVLRLEREKGVPDLVVRLLSDEASERLGRQDLRRVLPASLIRRAALAASPARTEYSKGASTLRNSNAKWPPRKRMS